MNKTNVLMHMFWVPIIEATITGMAQHYNIDLFTVNLTGILNKTIG